MGNKNTKDDHILKEGCSRIQDARGKEAKKISLENLESLKTCCEDIVLWNIFD